MTLTFIRNNVDHQDNDTVPEIDNYIHNTVSMTWSYFDIYHTDRVIYSKESNGVSFLVDGYLVEEKLRKKNIFSQQYLKYGTDFLSKLEGFFSVFVFDSIKQKLFIVTDHINSKKIFLKQRNGLFAFSDSIHSFKEANIRVNEPALGCFLSNGAVLNNQTLIQDVEILDRACIYTISESTIQRNRYWDFNITGDLEGIEEEDLKKKFKNIMIRSVEKYTDKNKTYYLSLSGGYDSSALLAILRYELNHDFLVPLTYYFNKIKIGSDSIVAQKMCDIAGYKLLKISISSDNLADNFDTNVKLFNGQSNFCDEIEAIAQLSSRHDQMDGIIFGEECFGWAEEKLLARRDAFTALHLYAMENMRGLKNIFCKDRFDFLQQKLEFEFVKASNKSPDFDSHFDFMHYLYLDQKISMIMSSWREFFYSNLARVINPFLDRELLDFIGRLPQSYRFSKSLFQETVSEKYPDIFNIHRAVRLPILPNRAYENFFMERRERVFQDFNTLIEFRNILSETEILKLIKKKRRINAKHKFFKYRRKLSHRAPFLCFDSLNVVPLGLTDFIKRFITLTQFYSGFSD